MINSHALYRLSYRGISVLISFKFVTVMRTSLHSRIVVSRRVDTLRLTLSLLCAVSLRQKQLSTVFGLLQLSYRGISVFIMLEFVTVIRTLKLL